MRIYMIRKISVYEQVTANLGDMLDDKIRKIPNSGSGSKKSISYENLSVSIFRVRHVKIECLEVGSRAIFSDYI